MFNYDGKKGKPIAANFASTYSNIGFNENGLGLNFLTFDGEIEAESYVRS